VRRRAFITLLGGAAVAWPLAARAQQPERMRRIGVLMPNNGRRNLAHRKSGPAGGIKAGVNERPSREAPMAQETVVRHRRGGIYFDDFVVGHLYEHPLTRTVTQMDNMLFSNMTLNPQPLHIDRQ
jgi:hypothetical protein